MHDRTKIKSGPHIQGSNLAVCIIEPTLYQVLISYMSYLAVCMMGPRMNQDLISVLPSSMQKVCSSVARSFSMVIIPGCCLSVSISPVTQGQLSSLSVSLSHSVELLPPSLFQFSTPLPGKHVHATHVKPTWLNDTLGRVVLSNPSTY